MKALLLAVCASVATFACSTEPVAVRVEEHNLSAGTGDVPTSTVPADSSPTTTATTEPPPALEVEPEPTTVPRTTTTVRATQTAPVIHGAMPAVLDRIAGCESGTGPTSPGSYTAQNPRSTASGRYQFIDSTWQGLTAAAGYSRAVYAPPAVQDAGALELYASAGTAPWAESRACWAA